MAARLEVLEARDPRIDLGDAIVGLGWQADLPAPVKLVGDREGPSTGAALRAEIWAGAGERVAQLAREALSLGRRWLDEGLPGSPSTHAVANAETWRELVPRPSEVLPGGSLRVHAPGEPGSVRLQLDALPGGAARVWTASAVPVASPQVARALALFALDANRRLRLARLSLSAATHGGTTDRVIARVVWDAVLPAEVVGEDAVRAALEAVAAAHAETRRALRALSSRTLAEAYLAFAGAAEPNSNRTGTGSETNPGNQPGKEAERWKQSTATRSSGG